MSKTLLPKYAFFVAGTGRHIDKLEAFDRALINAGPLAHNLVSVSSIIPAGCKIVSHEKGFSMLIPGQITFCVMARQETNKPRDIASAAVGIAVPKESKKFGYISEYHGDAKDREEAKKTAKRMAAEMFAVKLNTNVKKLNLKTLEATAASIKQRGDNEWVCAV